jgi:hypothetical protein
LKTISLWGLRAVERPRNFLRASRFVKYWRTLFTLRDAADYATSLPKKESDLPEWQAAIEVLMLASRGDPTMMARIGVMKALNRHVVRVFNPIAKIPIGGNGSPSGTSDRRFLAKRGL